MQVTVQTLNVLEYRGDPSDDLTREVTNINRTFARRPIPLLDGYYALTLGHTDLMRRNGRVVMNIDHFEVPPGVQCHPFEISGPKQIDLVGHEFPAVESQFLLLAEAPFTVKRHYVDRCDGGWHVEIYVAVPLAERLFQLRPWMD